MVGLTCHNAITRHHHGGWWFPHQFAVNLADARDDSTPRYIFVAWKREFKSSSGVESHLLHGHAGTSEWQEAEAAVASSASPTIQAAPSQRRELQERRPIVQQHVNALARQQLVARPVPGNGLGASTRADLVRTR
jgi:hypothetical protein